MLSAIRVDAPALVFVLALSACSAAGSSSSGEFSTGGDGGAAAASGGNTGSGNAASGSGSGSGATSTGVGGGFTVSSAASSTGQTVASSGAGTGGGCGGTPVDTPVPEVCGNGLDDDLNGFIDEVCGCSLGQTQSCFGGLPSQATNPNCTQGIQTCEGTTEFHGWGSCQGWSCGPTPPPPEICYDSIDNDCDGLIDEGCDLNVMVNIDGDCIYVSCPPQAPYPIGCSINMQGGDSRGCVASTPTGSTVYFKEGDKCPIFGFGDAGHIDGSLLCSTQPGAPLNDMNCPINKTDKFYPPDASGCP
jgi:hypothetical protein